MIDVWRCLVVLQWFTTYSQLLSGYMRRDTGIGMDLTLVRTMLPRKCLCFYVCKEKPCMQKDDLLLM